MGSADRNCTPHIRTFFDTEESDLGLCFRSYSESDCVALEQYLCGFPPVGNFGVGTFALLSTARTCFALGDNRLSTYFPFDGGGEE